MNMYYEFSFGDSMKRGHVLAHDDEQAALLVQAYLLASKLSPDDYQNLHVICSADLASLISAGLWNLQNLTLPEMLGVLQETKEANDNYLREVSKSAHEMVRQERRAMSAIPPNQYDHIDDEDCSVLASVAAGRRPTRVDKNNVLNSALSPLFQW